MSFNVSLMLANLVVEISPGILFFVCNLTEKRMMNVIAVRKIWVTYKINIIYKRYLEIRITGFSQLYERYREIIDRNEIYLNDRSRLIFLKMKI